MGKKNFKVERINILKKNKEFDQILSKHYQEYKANEMSRIGIGEIDLHKTIFAAYALINAQAYKDVDLKPFDAALEKTKNITSTECCALEDLKIFEDFFSVVMNLEQDKLFFTNICDSIIGFCKVFNHVFEGSQKKINAEFSVVTETIKQQVLDYNCDKMNLYKVSKACILLNDLDKNMFGWLSATLKPNKIQKAFDETKEAVLDVFSETPMKMANNLVV